MNEPQELSGNGGWEFTLLAERLPSMSSALGPISTATHVANKLFIRARYHRPSDLSATVPCVMGCYSLEPGTKLTFPSSNDLRQRICNRNKSNN